MRKKRTSSQAILPSAAALVVVAAVVGAFLPQPSTSATGGMLVRAPATGTAGFFRGFGGLGVRAISGQRPAVSARSFNSWGGHFVSDDGYGIRVDTSGTDHWDHAGFFTAQSGYAILAESANNMAIRGHAGDLTGVAQPLGPVGVVGLGANRGVYGASNSGIGVFATSVNNYGLWGTSTDFRGVTGRTSRSDNNYGLYTPDNLFAANASITGSTSQVVQNAGAVPLAPGDVAVFVGLGEPFGPNETRHVQVARADTVPGSAVAGVVQARYNTNMLLLDEPDPDALASLEPDELSLRDLEPAELWATRTEPAPPGEFLLMVTHGPAEVKASTVAAGSIRASDLLVAERGTARVARGADEGSPGRSIGTALTPLAAGEATIWAFVRPR